MFLTIFKKELMDQLISPKFLIVCLFCLILIPPSLLMNYKNYQKELFEYEFLENDYKDTQKIMYLPPTVHRKPSILSTFSLGLEDVLPKTSTFEKYKTVTTGTQAEHELLSNVTGKIDLVVISSILLGLFAILYASTSIVTEKETGTLKLILSNKTKRSTLLLGKYLAGYVVLILPLFLSFLIGLLLLIHNGFPMFSGDIFFRILALGVLTMLYLSTLFALGLFISSRLHKSSMALLFGFLIWVLLTFVIPKISKPIADLIHPTQSDEVMMMNRRQVRNQIELEKGRELSPLAKRYVFGSGSADFQKYREEREPIAKEYEERINRTLQNFDLQFQKEKNINTNLSILIGRLSPSLIYTYSSQNFCNTGLQERENFYRSLRTHHIQLSNIYFQYNYDDIIVDDNGRRSHISGTGGSRDFPEFRYEFLSSSEILNHALPDILLLILYNLIFFTGTYFSFIRYDVR